MTNYEIIAREAVANKIYTQEQVDYLIQNMMDIPLHTFSFWKDNGYMVKKGEKAKVKTRLWKFKKGTKKEDVAEVEDPEQDLAHFYLCNAYLFHSSQVERVGV